MHLRERVTFVQPLNQGVDPKLLTIKDDDTLTGPSISAVKEDRFAMNVDALPTELFTILGELKELHIRWVSPTSHHLIEPFASRMSPGLHVSFTPVNDTKFDPSKLCTYLSNLQQLDCQSFTAFTTRTQPESPNSPAYSFYQQLETPKLFQKFGVNEACGKADTKCLARLMELKEAASIDVAYHVDEPEAKRFRVSALWGQAERDVDVSQINKKVVGRVEAGVLSHDIPTNLQPHELGLSGVLTVLGESSSPSPTMFSVSSRHRVARGSFSSSFLPPTGLHPDLQLKFDSLKQPGEDEETCQLYSYLTLPKTIFADQYQLGDDLFLASKNLTALRSTTLPVDLEAPAYTTKVWGSSVLIQVSSKHDPSSAEIPLHLRYLEPSPAGYQNIEVPYPVVFWACKAAADVRLSDNPFDRKRLGYDSLFPEQTVFWHVTPQPEVGSRLTNEVKVPVLNTGSASWVELGTGIAIALGFGWVLFVVARVLMGSGGQVKQKTKEKTKKRQ